MNSWPAESDCYRNQQRIRRSAAGADIIIFMLKTSVLVATVTTVQALKLEQGELHRLNDLPQIQREAQNNEDDRRVQTLA